MKQRDTYIDKLRIFAIFSVVCAHVGAINEGASYANALASTLLGCIGAMGVPVFFIISGYLYEKTEKSFVSFWKSRFRTLIVPWFLCETCLWFYVVLRKGGISFWNWLKFLVGYQSTTYYLTLLVVFYILFWKIKKVRWILLVGSFVSAVQIVSTGWNIQPLAGYSGIFGTAYLNPFHFMIYFCIGMLMELYHLWDLIAEKCAKYLLISAMCLTLTVFLHIYKGWSFSYFSNYALLNTLFSTATIMGMARWMQRKQWNGLDLVGKWSFSIYLLYQFLAGFLVQITNLVDVWVVTLLRPVITISIVMLVIIILNKINDKLHGKLHICLTIIGAR